MNFACGKLPMRSEIEKLKRFWVCRKIQLGLQGVDRVWKILLYRHENIVLLLLTAW